MLLIGELLRSKAILERRQAAVKRSALLRELLSNNSLFVGQLYGNKSLALRARDLIFFTTDTQTVTELLLNNSLLDLIYFLNNDQI